MIKERIMKFAEDKGDKAVYENLKKHFDAIARTYPVDAKSIASHQELFDRKLERLLGAKDEFAYKLFSAFIINESMKIVETIDTTVYDRLQVIYESLFLDILAEKMWEISYGEVYRNENPQS